MKGLSCTASIAHSSHRYRAYQLHPDRKNRWMIALGSVQADTSFTYCVEMVDVGGESIPNPYATELFLVVQGEGRVQFTCKTMPLQPGESVLVSPSETQSVRNVGTERLYLLRIMPDEAFAQQIDRAIPVELDEQDLAVLHQSTLAISHHFPFVAPVSSL